MASRLESVYSLLPVWAQNIGITLYGMGWRHERRGGGFDRYVREFEEREREDPGAMARHVESELRRTLCHAFETVPYYRRAWRAAGLGFADVAAVTLGILPQIPITPKQALRDEPWSFVAADERHRPRGLRTYLSSGSTGTPVSAICSADGQRKFIAAREARSFRWAGTSLLGSRSMIGGRMVVPAAQVGPPFHRYNAAERQVYFSAFHISPANARHYVAALDRYRPEVLTGYAVSHWLLARLMREQGLELAYRPRALVLSSEKLTPEMKQDLLEAFGARAFEEYGAVENCHLATECEERRLHVSPDFGIVEIVDDDGRPTAPGVPGRVLSTGLLNEAQPLIRYEIGDTAAWDGNPCPCGREGFPVLQEVVGRTEDVVTGPDGRQMVRFHGVFVGLRTVRMGQVVQKTRERILVRVVPAGELAEADRDEIARRIVERLPGVAVEVETASAIERTRAGKYRAVLVEGS